MFVIDRCTNIGKFIKAIGEDIDPENDVLHLVVKNLKKISDRLKSCSLGWKLSRISCGFHLTKLKETMNSYWNF